jgi:hypothetical protein
MTTKKVYCDFILTHFFSYNSAASKLFLKNFYLLFLEKYQHFYKGIIGSIVTYCEVLALATISSQLSKSPCIRYLNFLVLFFPQNPNKN